ncbi:MAG: hypothetical protein QGG40_13155, partial [Myxococcota bacterium]|nr:hypothetical protein [Myxococcota bacterium]
TGQAPRTELGAGLAVSGATGAWTAWRAGQAARALGPACTPQTCPDAPELFDAANASYSSALPSWSLADLLNLSEHTSAYPWVLGLLVGFAVIGWVQGRHRPGPQVHAAGWILLGGLGGVIGLAVVGTILPIPGPTPVRLLVFAVPVAAALVWSEVLGRPGPPSAPPRAKLRAMVLGLPLLCAAGLTRPAELANDYRGAQPLFEAIETLPPGTVIGGHPLLLDPIPLVTGRRVEVMADAFNPWQSDWWRDYKARLERSLDLTYAADDVSVREDCEASAVTHLVVAGEIFVAERATAPDLLDWEPMASGVRRRINQPPHALRARAGPGEVCLLSCETLQGECWPFEPWW